MGVAVSSLTTPMRVASVAVILGAAFGALVTLQPISDSDLFWHLETGRRTLVLDLPRYDVFSWTVNGAAVFTDQWLGDLLLALARAVGDWRGVLALRALAVGALVTLIVDTARSLGRPVSVHAQTPEGMRRAILAGAETIEHGDAGTPEVFKLMADHGVALCPTLAAGDAGFSVAIGPPHRSTLMVESARITPGYRRIPVSEHR